MNLVSLAERIERYLVDAGHHVERLTSPDPDGGAWMCEHWLMDTHFFVSVESNKDDLKTPTVTIGAIIETFDPDDEENQLGLEKALDYLDLAGSLIDAAMTVTRLGLNSPQMIAVVSRIPVEQFQVDKIEEKLQFNVSQLAALTGINDD